MAQKKFTFSKHFQSLYPENYIPPAHISVEGEFVSKLLKQGYIVREVRVEKVIKISCLAARANIPPKERLKLQREIEHKFKGKSS